MHELYHDSPDSEPSTRKICKKCGIEKPLEEFYRDARYDDRDGRMPMCKMCFKNPPIKIVQKPLIVLSKVCTKCGIDRPIEEFYVRNGSPVAACKKCLLTHSSANYWKTHNPAPVAAPGMKICSVCKVEKPVSAFRKQSGHKDGLMSACRDCKSGHENSKIILKLPPAVHGGKVCTKCRKEKPFDAFSLNKRAKDGHYIWCKECASASARRTYAVRDNTTTLQKRREWYQNNAEYHHQLVRQWKERNPLAVNEIVRRWNAKRRHAIIDKVDYAAILERDGMWCYICERDILEGQNIDFDHVIPLTPRKGRKPGMHIAENIKPTHATCNRRKNNKLLEEMTPYQRRGIE